jgi:hypothetical protein
VTLREQEASRGAPVVEHELDAFDAQRGQERFDEGCVAVDR